MNVFVQGEGKEIKLPINMVLYNDDEMKLKLHEIELHMKNPIGMIANSIKDPNGNRIEIQEPVEYSP